MLPLILASFPVLGLTLISCGLPTGDPASATLAILHKRPASFTERLVAMDDLTRKTRGLPGMPALAESLAVHQTRLKKHWQPQENALQKINRIRSFVYDSLGLTVQDNQSPQTPMEVSLPSWVLTRRQGDCVGLTLLFLAYAEAVGMPLQPVFLPGHITLSLVQKGGPLFLETLRPKENRDSVFYREAFTLAKRPWYASLKPHGPEKALLALAFNLANYLREKGDAHAALGIYRLVDQALPGLPEAQGNMGLMLAAAGNHEQAMEHIAKAQWGDSLAGSKARTAVEKQLNSSSH